MHPDMDKDNFPYEAKYRSVGFFISTLNTDYEPQNTRNEPYYFYHHQTGALLFGTLEDELATTAGYVPINETVNPIIA